MAAKQRHQPDLLINGIRLPMGAAGEITQTYSPLGGFSTMRLGAGAAVQQKRWRKVATTLSASGHVPPGLDAIDWDAPVTLGCVQARAIQSASNVVTLPTVRRTDAAPYGFAVMDAGQHLLRTEVTVVGDVATLAPVSGAVAYVVHYYPLLTVVTDGPGLSFDAGTCVASWDLQAEEV